MWSTPETSHTATALYSALCSAPADLAEAARLRFSYSYSGRQGSAWPVVPAPPLPDTLSDCITAVERAVGAATDIAQDAGKRQVFVCVDVQAIGYTSGRLLCTFSATPPGDGDGDGQLVAVVHQLRSAIRDRDAQIAALHTGIHGQCSRSLALVREVQLLAHELTLAGAGRENAGSIRARGEADAARIAARRATWSELAEVVSPVLGDVASEAVRAVRESASRPDLADAQVDSLILLCPTAAVAYRRGDAQACAVALESAGLGPSDVPPWLAMWLSDCSPS